eukprot:3878726-Amphidinium_carterae.1
MSTLLTARITWMRASPGCRSLEAFLSSNAPGPRDSDAALCMDVLPRGSKAVCGHMGIAQGLHITWMPPSGSTPSKLFVAQPNLFSC